MPNCTIMRTSIPENWILTSLYCAVVLGYLGCVMISDLRNVRSSGIPLSSGEAAIIFIFAIWGIIPGLILVFDTGRNRVYKAAIGLAFGALGDYLLYTAEYDAFSQTTTAILFNCGVFAFTLLHCFLLAFYYPYIIKQIWWVYAIYAIVFITAFAILLTVFKMYTDPVLCIVTFIYGIIMCLAGCWAVLTQNKLSISGYIFHTVSDLMLLYGLVIELNETGLAIYGVVFMILYWMAIYCIGAGSIQLSKQQKQSDPPQQEATQMELSSLKDI